MHSSLFSSQKLPIIDMLLSYSRIHLWDFLYIFSKGLLDFLEGVLNDHWDLHLFLICFRTIFLCLGEWNHSFTMILAITKIIASLKMFVAYFDQIIRMFIINKKVSFSKSEKIFNPLRIFYFNLNIAFQRANTEKLKYNCY